MEFFGVLLLLVVLFLAYREYQKIKKGKQINKAINVLTKGLRQTNKSTNAVTLGVGAVSLSLYDIYASVHNHEEILNVLEQRFPDEVGDYSAIDWYNKISSLYNQNSIDAYVSAYAGQQAENLTVDFFQSQGLKAELFGSRIHENNDVRVYNSDGTYTDYSVKTYSSADNFNQAVSVHPQSTHYVVNSELYEELEDKGLIEQYKQNGITIIDGDYSNVELREEALGIFNDIQEAGDVADSIPIIAGIFFGFKTYRNITNLRKGLQSKNEFRVNILSDTFRLGTSGLSAIPGAKVGAAIGTLLSPGVGTIIGGGIGAIIAAYSGSKLINWVIGQIKWSDIFAAQSHFSKLNWLKFDESLSLSAKNHIFGLEELKKELEEEERLFNNRYYTEHDPYLLNDNVTISAVLCRLHIHVLKLKIAQIEKTMENTREDLKELTGQIAEKMTKGDPLHRGQVQKRLYGELFLTNDEIFPIVLDKHSGELKQKYKLQKEKNPNYPTQYQHPMNSKDIFVGVAMNNFNRLNKSLDFHLPIIKKSNWVIYIVLFLIAIQMITSSLYTILCFSSLAFILVIFMRKFLKKYEFIK